MKRAIETRTASSTHEEVRNGISNSRAISNVSVSLQEAERAKYRSQLQSILSELYSTNGPNSTLFEPRRPIFEQRIASGKRTKRKDLACNAIIAFVALTSILLSGAVIAACVAYTLTSLQTGIARTLGTPRYLTSATVHRVNQLSEDLYYIKTKEKNAKVIEQRKAEELLMQVEAINHTIQYTIPMIRTPPTPDTSGLAHPALISIDTTTGCEEIKQSQLIFFVSVRLSSMHTLPHFDT